MLISDFYNWHKVYVYYCDGSSFMSDIKHVDPVSLASIVS